MFLGGSIIYESRGMLEGRKRNQTKMPNLKSKQLAIGSVKSMWQRKQMQTISMPWTR